MVRIRHAILSAFIAVVSAQSASTQEGSSAPIPMPGKLVDIGGWKLHLNCTGTARAGQPTVVLEAGAGDISVEWSLVQPEVAQFARVCSYDRAGAGWSELGPYPRTFHQIAYELHTLLEKAGDPKPYLLVGHSFGGWPTRTFQIEYPADVAGMVLVEAGHDDPLRMLGDGKVVRASDLVRGTPIPPVKKSSPLRVEDIPPDAINAIRSGMAESARRALEPPRDRLPPDAQKMRLWSFSQIGIYVNGNPAEIEELAWLRAERKKSEHPLGNLPLVVYTRGKSDDEGPDSKANEAERFKEHEAIAQMSTRGKHLVAAKSGHHIQIEQPELVVAAIREVLARSSPDGGDVDMPGARHSDKTPCTDAGLRATAAAWDRAMVSNDADAILAFMAEDWRIIGADGGVTDRSTFLAQIRDGRLSHDTMSTEDAHVRIYGSVGILVARGVSAGRFDGRPFRVVERQSNVFVHDAGAWRCVLTHLSPLAG